MSLGYITTADPETHLRLSTPVLERIFHRSDVAHM